jgi:hypothetical protein
MEERERERVRERERDRRERGRRRKLLGCWVLMDVMGLAGLPNHPTASIHLLEIHQERTEQASGDL